MIKDAIARKVFAEFSGLTLDDRGEKALSAFNLHPVVRLGWSFLKGIYPGKTLSEALGASADWYENLSNGSKDHIMSSALAKMFPDYPVMELLNAAAEDPVSFREEMRSLLPDVAVGVVKKLAPVTYELVRCPLCTNPYEVSGPDQPCPFCSKD